VRGMELRARDKVLVNGMVWGRVEPLVDPIDYEDFLKRIIDALGKPKEGFRPDMEHARGSLLRRSAFEFRAPNFDDPKEVKWALLLPPKTPKTEGIAEALGPLVTQRGGQVIYLPASPETWLNTYKYMPDSERPYYLLIAGKPKDVAFRFQYLLDVNAAVGRIYFDKVEEYAAYAKKVVEFETRSGAFVNRRAVFFAPEQPGDGATFLSRRYMADPLVKRLSQDGVPVTYVSGADATLKTLKSALTENRDGHAPALVYTASHGLGVPGTGDSAEQSRRRLQGSIVCQDYDGANGIFSADEVPANSFLHGSLVFTFACYGAGTPRSSDFFHWYRDPRLLDCRPTEDFVAALPKRLLSHPQGPLAVFGHIDPSWVYSFADPEALATDQGWGARMGPFREAVNNLLKGSTVGYAVKMFNSIYAIVSVDLASKEDEFVKNQTVRGDEKWSRALVDTWMTRNDMQNFIVLGDPAARAKMATG
jgi:hypothetical protein